MKKWVTEKQGFKDQIAQFIVSVVVGVYKDQSAHDQAKYAWEVADEMEKEREARGVDYEPEITFTATPAPPPTINVDSYSIQLLSRLSAMMGPRGRRWCSWCGELSTEHYEKCALHLFLTNGETIAFGNDEVHG